MSCAVCGSANQVEFPTEMAIHFSSKENQDQPQVFAFPKLLVCLDCGFSRCTIPETALHALRKGRTLRPSA